MTTDKYKRLSATAQAKLAQLEAASAEYRQMVLTAEAEAKRRAAELTAKSRSKRDGLVLDAWVLMGGEAARDDRAKRQHGLNAKLIKEAAGITQHRDYLQIIEDADWTSPDIDIDWTQTQPYLTNPWDAKWMYGYDLDRHGLQVNRFYKWEGSQFFRCYPYAHSGGGVDVYIQIPNWEGEIKFQDWDQLDIALPSVDTERRAEIVQAFHEFAYTQYKNRG